MEKEWNISNKTHCSKSDPDATLAYKLGSQRGLKYKAHVCCDTKSRVIAAIKITTGAVHDFQPYLNLIDYLKTKLALSIDEVVADRAYGSGEILASLKAAGIQTFIPLFTTRSGVNKYSQFQDLNFHIEKNTFVCPANIEFKVGQVNSQGFITYRTSTKDCRNCSLKDSCTVPQEKGRETRIIARHIHGEIFQQVKLEMQTEHFKQKLRERLWKIEGIMNELKNIHCLRRAMSRGLNEIQIQAYMSAIAINIKRLILIYAYNFLILTGQY